MIDLEFVGEHHARAGQACDKEQTYRKGALLHLISLHFGRRFNIRSYSYVVKQFVASASAATQELACGHPQARRSHDGSARMEAASASWLHIPSLCLTPRSDDTPTVPR
jgi:hypothetical protein